MIPRYSRPEMELIWSDKTRFEIWLEVETLALEAMAQQGLVPAEAVQEVRKKAKIDPARIFEIEREVKHDVIAFLTNVAESVGPSARFLHRGMTSNDMLDTSFAVQLTRSGALILTGIDALLAALKKRAHEFRTTVCVGRTHGIQAEPISFGVKLAGFYAEIKRQRERFERAVKSVAVGKLSGAVGTYASLPPEIEQFVLNKLSLQPETVATQVVARDRHAEFFLAIAQLGTSIERLCLEIRHLQRTEVGEAEEPFASGQKGSSAMPHKKNPILSENLTGLARLLRGYAWSALENVPLWHERDISHSSVERVAAPDACIVADFMLHRLQGLIAGLVVHPERMRVNLEASNGLVFSGTLLIALADAGISRENAYRMVQKHALITEPQGPSLQDRVTADAEIVQALGAEKIAHIFDLSRHLQHVDMVFDRTFQG